MANAIYLMFEPAFEYKSSKNLKNIGPVHSGSITTVNNASELLSRAWGLEANTAFTVFVDYVDKAKSKTTKDQQGSSAPNSPVAVPTGGEVTKSPIEILSEDETEDRLFMQLGHFIEKVLPAFCGDEEASTMEGARLTTRKDSKVVAQVHAHAFISFIIRTLHFIIRRICFGDLARILHS